MATNKYSKALDHFKKVDPKIYAVLKKVDIDKWFGDHPMGRSVNDYFNSLCRIIIGQQLSGKAANSIYAKYLLLFSGKPTPKKILEIKVEKLRGAGLSNAKAIYIKNIAKAVSENEFNLKIIDTLSDKEVASELIKIKGVGPWTAEMFLMFTLGREDVFSHGDLGLKKGIMKVYKIRKVTPKRVEKIISKWSPYKTYGAIALWESLERE